MNSLLIEKTSDGSGTLYLPELDEHYHSIKGARTESLHVYIHTAFNFCTLREVRVLEIGFGTGLNAFLTWQQAKENGRRVFYTSLELYPLKWDTVDKLRYTDFMTREEAVCFQKLHFLPWDYPSPVSPGYTLFKVQADFRDYALPEFYDVVYYDAFAPDKQPELWEEELFLRIFRQLSPGGILATYCAKGEIRRRLQRAGFSVERLPGPPGGKREILRASKPSFSEEGKRP